MTGRTFALTADVKEAHRQVSNDPQTCTKHRFSLGNRIHQNGGQFCIALASCYWSRVASALGRLSQYISGHGTHTWHLLVADDFSLEAGGVGHREAFIVFFVLSKVSRVPLSGQKTAGGDTVAWVGFELSKSRRDGRHGSLDGLRSIGGWQHQHELF